MCSYCKWVIRYECCVPDSSPSSSHACGLRRCLPSRKVREPTAGPFPTPTAWVNVSFYLPKTVPTLIVLIHRLQWRRCQTWRVPFDCQRCRRKRWQPDSAASTRQEQGAVDGETEAHPEASAHHTRIRNAATYARKSYPSVLACRNKQWSV